MANKYSVVIRGSCPSNLQNPLGKIIPIAVVGTFPYVVYGKDKEWIGGTEFKIIDVYAKKFGFTPKYVRAKGYDNEGSAVEMVRIKIRHTGGYSTLVTVHGESSILSCGWFFLYPSSPLIT